MLAWACAISSFPSLLFPICARFVSHFLHFVRAYVNNEIYTSCTDTDTDIVDKLINLYVYKKVKINL